MRIQQHALDSVAFLCAKTSTGQFHFGGTAFFVSLASVTFPELRFIYLVTARHNLEKASRTGQLYVSMNIRGGGAGYLEVGGEWFFPESESSDVAVIPFLPDPNYFDYRPIPLSIALTQEHIREFQVRPGEDVAAVGLFTQHYGRERNLPVVRQGTIAMMPIEPLQDTNTGLYYDAFLIEMTSVGGMSGSPVFLQARPREVDGKTLRGRMFLLGVVRGHWDLRVGGDGDSGRDSELLQVNANIASVTPILDVLAVISSREVAKTRREAEAECKRAAGSGQ